MRIGRESLLSSLELLRPGLSPKDVVEQSASFAFRDGQAMTFNGEIACSIKSPLKITGSVAAQPLLDLLHKLVETDVEVVADSKRLKIIGKRKQAGIRLEKDVTLPIESVETPTAWHKLPEDFCEGVEAVQGCAGKDESMFALTCVNIHPKWVEAFDNIRAARYRVKTGVSEPVTVQRDAIKHITALGMTHICETPTWIHFRNQEKLVFSCRKFIVEYPSLTEILNVSGEKIALPRGLSDAADRADIFSRENADSNSVAVELVSGKLKVKGSGSLGWYSESKKIKYAGPQLTFLISPKMLSEIVQRHSVCELANNCLKVSGGKFSFVTLLRVPGNDEIEVEDAN